MSEFSKPSRALLVLLSAAGVAGVAPIAWRQMSGLELCPSLGVVPACYLVLASYLLIVISALLRPRASTVTFLVAWVPLVSLALMGSGLELVRPETCPQTAAGLPKCFLSLGLSVLLMLVFLVEKYKKPNPAKY